MKAKKISLIMAAILALTLIFRLINFEKSFLFAHDQDLYSWIAKDILVNHHQRLVGQITSVDGVFIGSFYYYLMAFFYGIFKMNPLSAAGAVVLFSAGNIFSLYWIIKKHFGIKPAVISTLIYGISFGIAKFDRWSVPTLPTLTWSIWFTEVIIELYKGNLKFLPLYGFLAAFTWQVHIALLPVLPLPILAYFAGGNKLNLIFSREWGQQAIAGIAIFLLVLSPFLIFELKHNFSQIKAMISANQKDNGGPTGKMKIIKVEESASREFQQRLFFGLKTQNTIIYWLIFVLISTVLTATGKVPVRLMMIFWLWYLMILAAQFVSKRVVSEYYFTNLLPIYILFLGIFMGSFWNTLTLSSVLFIYFLFNSWWLFTRTDEDQSYYYHRQIVETIKNDVLKNNYPCIAVNFIADPGVGVGFRYLFWYHQINLVKPGTPGVPIYNIPIPWQLSMNENPIHFGRFGVLIPEKSPNNFENLCNIPQYQPDPLLGYTQ